MYDTRDTSTQLAYSHQQMQKIIYTPEYIFLSVFLHDVSTIPPRSGDLQKTIFVFSWSHLDQVEK